MELCAVFFSPLRLKEYEEEEIFLNALFYKCMAVFLKYVLIYDLSFRVIIFLYMNWSS